MLRGLPRFSIATGWRSGGESPMASKNDGTRSVPYSASPLDPADAEHDLADRLAVDKHIQGVRVAF